MNLRDKANTADFFFGGGGGGGGVIWYTSVKQHSQYIVNVVSTLTLYFFNTNLFYLFFFDDW